MTSQHERLSSSRDYRMEAEHTRRRLAEHLDELSDRLTPGQVFDEMLTYTRAGRGTFFRAFSNAMRENPVPSLLIGAGCMMFLSEKMGLRPGGGGNGGARRAMRTSDEGYDPYRPNMPAPEQPGRMADASARVGDAAGRMGDATGRMSEAATSTARSAAASVQAGARRTADVAGQQAGGAASAVKQAAAAVGDTMAGAADAVRSSTYGLRDQATGAVDRDPPRRSGSDARCVVIAQRPYLGHRRADAAGRGRGGAPEPGFGDLLHYRAADTLRCDRRRGRRGHRQHAAVNRDGRRVDGGSKRLGQRKRQSGRLAGCLRRPGQRKERRRQGCRAGAGSDEGGRPDAERFH